MTRDEKDTIAMLEHLRAVAAGMPRESAGRKGILSLADLFEAIGRFHFRQSARDTKYKSDLADAVRLDVPKPETADELEQRSDARYRIGRLFRRQFARFSKEFRRYSRRPPNDIGRFSLAWEGLNSFLAKDERRGI
jgi:hypothetical protein